MGNALSTADNTDTNELPKGPGVVYFNEDGSAYGYIALSPTSPEQRVQAKGGYDANTVRLNGDGFELVLNRIENPVEANAATGKRAGPRLKGFLVYRGTGESIKVAAFLNADGSYGLKRENDRHVSPF